jgi:hypothetical protein
MAALDDKGVGGASNSLPVWTQSCTQVLKENQTGVINGMYYIM